MDLDLDLMREEYERILAEHADLIERAKGFGFRAAYDRRAALPKGLMPYAEAKKIVDEFEKGPRRLLEQLESLRSARESLVNKRGGSPNFLPSYEYREYLNYGKLIEDLEKSLALFKGDWKKAQEALDRHEDLLVGEHFQEAFEAVRHAILNLKLAEDIDIDVKTEIIRGDQKGDRAAGFLEFFRGPTRIYWVTVMYKADEDRYWSRYGVERNTSLGLVEKIGRAYLPRFVREIADKVLADDKLNSRGLFRTRRKVDVTQVLTPGKKASASRVSRAYALRCAGTSSFDSYSEEANVRDAFYDAIAQAREAGEFNEDSGQMENPGSIATKSSYVIRRNDPLPLKEAYEFSRHDFLKSEKWGPAFAIPVEKPQVRSSEKVTVLVKAKTEKDALREGAMRIKITGRIPPKVVVNVSEPKAEKVAPGTYEVTGNRELITGKGVTVGWLFYGWAADYY